MAKAVAPKTPRPAKAAYRAADGEDPVVLVRGDDPVLRDSAVRALVRKSMAGEDLALGVDDLGDEGELCVAVDSASTPPMFTSRRVVVLRDVGRFGASAIEPLLDYLASPIPTTVLILVGGGGQIPRKLLDAVKAVGRVEDTGVPTGRARDQWLQDRLVKAEVRLDGAAVARLGEHLGEDLSRVDGIMSVLTAVFGEGARVSAGDLEPFLGASGAGAPWDLTDAVDSGEVGRALGQLQRQLGGGDRHPLQVMASLQAHFGRMLRLDGAGVRDETEAAALLGMTGSTFPAKKALGQLRRIGSDGVRRATLLLAQADLDLRGVRDLSGHQVMELLVARLTRLAPGGGARR